MPTRRTLALLLVCLIVPALASCSDDSDSGAAASTTSGKANSTEVPTTQPQVPFAEGIVTMQNNLAAAKGDVCALVNSLGAVNIANPATPEEAKQAVEVVVGYLDAIADAVPDQGGTLHDAAANFAAEAQAANYDVSALNESKVMSDPKTTAALNAATQKCTSRASG